MLAICKYFSFTFYSHNVLDFTSCSIVRKLNMFLSGPTVVYRSTHNNILQSCPDCCMYAPITHTHSHNTATSMHLKLNVQNAFNIVVVDELFKVIRTFQPNHEVDSHSPHIPNMHTHTNKHSCVCVWLFYLSRRQKSGGGHTIIQSHTQFFFVGLLVCVLFPAKNSQVPHIFKNSPYTHTNTHTRIYAP